MIRGSFDAKLGMIRQAEPQPRTLAVTVGVHAEISFQTIKLVFTGGDRLNPIAMIEPAHFILI